MRRSAHHQLYAVTLGAVHALQDIEAWGDVGRHEEVAVVQEALLIHQLAALAI